MPPVTWIDLEGAANVRDVGGLYLGQAFVAGLAELLRVAALGIIGAGDERAIFSAAQ